MKKLLIILVLFAGINCQAQTDDAFKKYTDAVTEQFNFVFKELKQRTLLIEVLSDRSSTQGAKIRMLEDRINELEKKVNSITIESLIDYQKECYNDSTLVQTYVMKRSKHQSSIGDNNMEIDYIETPYPYQYEYRHKPTLEGFIEYMKRQMK